MPSEEVEIYFSQLNAVVEQLQQLTKMMTEQMQTYFGEVLFSDLQGWVSENRELLFVTENKLFDQSMEITEKLEKATEEISKKTKQFYEAERWNYLTAKARTYR